VEGERVGRREEEDKSIEEGGDEGRKEDRLEEERGRVEWICVFETYYE
jgi:hypothetical protein